MSEWGGRQAATLIIGVSTAVRVVCTVLVPDYTSMLAPAWGPDAPVYSAAAAEMQVRGMLAGGLYGIPFWPAGYPMFLGAMFTLTGLSLAGLIAVFVVQHLLLSAALWITFRLVERELSTQVGLITLLLLAISPALNLSAGVYMYEPLLALAAVASADLVSRASHEPPGRRRNAYGVAAFLVAGLGATLQPKLLAVGLVWLAWLIWRTRQTALPLLCALAMAVGPLALASRNAAAGEGFVVSANLGFTMLTGANDHARGGYVDDALVAATCGGREAEPDAALDREWRRCALRWMATHPARYTALAVAKAAHFWMPFSGVLGQRGTWRHGLDYWGRLPGGLTADARFRTLDIALGLAWMLGLLGLIAAGARSIARDPATRAALPLFAGPVLVFLLISMATIGDARFRLPVAPFYSALLACGLRDWVLFGKRHRASHADPVALSEEAA